MSRIALTVFAVMLAILVVRGGWVLLPSGWRACCSCPRVPGSRSPAGRGSRGCSGPDARAAGAPALVGMGIAAFTNLLMDPTDTGTEAAAEPSVTATPAQTGPATTPRPPTTPGPTTPHPSPSPSELTTTSTAAPPPAADGSAMAALGTLEVKGRAPRTGYERSQFGQRWADVDRNGCDTRNDILARDLTDKTFKPGTRDCVVLTGTLEDPFTGTVIHFVRGEVTSNAVQIDHVVSVPVT